MTFQEYASQIKAHGITFRAAGRINKSYTAKHAYGPDGEFLTTLIVFENDGYLGIFTEVPSNKIDGDADFLLHSFSKAGAAQ